MPMKPVLSNISSMPLIECFSLLCFHHTVDVLLLFSSVHSAIHNLNQENKTSYSLLFVFFVISFICTQACSEQKDMMYCKNLKDVCVNDRLLSQGKTSTSKLGCLFFIHLLMNGRHFFLSFK